MSTLTLSLTTWIIDYFKTCVSLVITGLSNLPRLIVSLIPYFIILTAFGGFVLWNGGVVLGKLSYLSTFTVGNKRIILMYA